MKTISGPRVLSIKQPWAWAIAQDRKRVENRDWSTPYRGRIYIHASGKLDRTGVEDVDVVTKSRAARFGWWFSGKYGFVLANIRRLKKPVGTSGKLNLYRPSSAVIRYVECQFRSKRGR